MAALINVCRRFEDFASCGVSRYKSSCVLRFSMNSLNFCGTSGGGVYPLHGVSSMLFDLHHQMAEQYHVYPAASPAVHTLSVAERLAGGSCCGGTFLPL